MIPWPGAWAPALEVLAERVIILLPFEVGMETDIYRLAKAGQVCLRGAVGIRAVLCPWGRASASTASGRAHRPLFVGGTLTATSDVFGVLTLTFLYQLAVKHRVRRQTMEAPAPG